MGRWAHESSLKCLYPGIQLEILTQALDAPETARDWRKFSPRMLRHLRTSISTSIRSSLQQGRTQPKLLHKRSSMPGVRLLVITSALPRLLPPDRVCKILAGHTTLFAQDLITVQENRIS